MRQKNAIIPTILIIGIPVLLIIFSIIFALNLNRFGSDADLLSIGITIDLVLVVPLIYFGLIRKKNISKFTIMPFFVIGLIVATFVIPAAKQQTLDLIKTWLLPLVEITVVTLVIIKVRKIRKAYQAKKTGDIDFVTALKESAASILPQKLAYGLATEIGLFYYTFVTWKKPNYASNMFTYHKESGIQGILGAVLGVALIELFCVHLLIYENHPILSWVLTAISAYGVIQLIGLMKSIPRVPHFITAEHLVLRMGIFQETKIPLSAIESVELTTADYPKKEKAYAKITLFDHNCIIHLKEEATLHGLFGMTKQYTHLVLSIDDKKSVKTMIENAI
ncbi:MAG: hypothetical protein GQ574_16075 [Crocinitomix sp.]|nr:hypothetical protein [Crocinitomix sp.]